MLLQHETSILTEARAGERTDKEMQEPASQGEQQQPAEQMQTLYHAPEVRSHVWGGEQGCGNPGLFLKITLKNLKQGDLLRSVF